MFQRYQKVLDDVTPFLIGRWIGAGLLTLAFLLRIFLLQVRFKDFNLALNTYIVK